MTVVRFAFEEKQKQGKGMTSDARDIRFELERIEQVWAKTSQSKKLAGMDRKGVHIVLPSTDPENVIASFSSEDEAQAYSLASGHIKRLTELVKTLLREKEEAVKGYKDIFHLLSQDPSHAMETTKEWCSYILENYGAE